MSTLHWQALALRIVGLAYTVFSVFYFNVSGRWFWICGAIGTVLWVAGGIVLRKANKVG